ncbi:hypothetical protein [Paenibacillus sp. JZ16]|uniref:hypothetical protein n=1 Tax=Paenibacillus sp. JZ16 TaxID=1906272 RepID=UPI001F2FB7DD|nr:hypothetical protein [Paenibacillus sp. JZ16]
MKERLEYIMFLFMPVRLARSMSFCLLLNRIYFAISHRLAMRLDEYTFRSQMLMSLHTYFEKCSVHTMMIRR